jgi:intraflagellar transport protein 20
LSSEISQFQTIVDGYISVVQNLSKQVEKEKIKVTVFTFFAARRKTSFQAIGLRNLRQSLTKQKEMEVQQLQALIREKQIQLERYWLTFSSSVLGNCHFRLRLQHDSLVKEEAQQRETIQQLLAPI